MTVENRRLHALSRKVYFEGCYANRECLTLDRQRKTPRKTNPITAHLMELVRTSQSRALTR